MVTWEKLSPGVRWKLNTACLAHPKKWGQGAIFHSKNFPKAGVGLTKLV